MICEQIKKGMGNLLNMRQEDFHFRISNINIQNKYTYSSGKSWNASDVECRL